MELWIRLGLYVSTEFFWYLFIPVIQYEERPRSSTVAICIGIASIWRRTGGHKTTREFLSHTKWRETIGLTLNKVHA